MSNFASTNFPTTDTSISTQRRLTGKAHISEDMTTMEENIKQEENRVARNRRFYVLVVGIMFFFGCHNYMQELIMTLPGFKTGVYLGYLEVLGVAICSYGERFVLKDFSRRAPLSTYLTLCLCLLVSSGTSNLALNFINYPTKVVFRSCKLIPTIIIAMVYLKKTVHWFEVMFGIFISIGMILFAAADFKTQPNFNPLGIGLVSISVVADAFLPNFQERVFEFGSSRVEVTFFTNALCLVAMTGAFSASGDLQVAVEYTFRDTHTFLVMACYTFLAYIAVSLHMMLVKEFGGIAAVLVGNTRKAMTIVLSFVLFPKPMSYLYALGVILVFGSLIGNAIMKERLHGAGKKGSAPMIGGF